ncbi:hypothetical protein CesoFtcFv8_016618 [Champsocephalus esox]|uniref:Uncharacterized protein n=1 Tax=Champsocephalus esox TaxID=159716 RepID=A0AAN8GRQ8_9TELE|nr:hypothetical protein CesoFtcFv8_016618 [Champsocephalus esox]
MQSQQQSIHQSHATTSRAGIVFRNDTEPPLTITGSGVMMIIVMRVNPRSTSSFLHPAPGRATHGSNLPLQHHLVTTAVIQGAFSQMNEEKINSTPSHVFAPHL